MSKYDSLFGKDTLIDVMNKNTREFNDVPNSTQFGIHLGISSSNFFGTDAHKIDSISQIQGYKLGNRFGLLFGGSLNYVIHKNLHIAIDMDYTMKGKKIYAKTDDIIETQILRINYLEMPILLKINFPTPSHFKPCVFFGPSISWLTSAESYYRLSKNGDVFDTSASIINAIKDKEYGIMFGFGGYEYVNDILSTFDVRFSIGLTTIDNSPSNQGIIKNWQFALIAGFYI